MSDPRAAAQPYPYPPPAQGRPSRAPWIVAAVAVVVAFAAVVVLAVTLVAADDEGTSDGAAERGFDSPQEAVTFLVD